MLLTSVIFAGASLIVGIFMGLAAGRHEERKEWEARIGRSMVDALGAGRSKDVNSLNPDSRSERMEQAIEAIAIEVERVAEGQRFVTKLLAERGQSLPDRVAQPKQSITPH